MGEIKLGLANLAKVCMNISLQLGLFAGLVAAMVCEQYNHNSRTFDALCQRAHPMNTLVERATATADQILAAAAARPSAKQSVALAEKSGACSVHDTNLGDWIDDKSILLDEVSYWRGLVVGPDTNYNGNLPNHHLKADVYAANYITAAGAKEKALGICDVQSLYNIAAEGWLCSCYNRELQ